MSTLDRIREGIALRVAGDNAAAREVFAALWPEVADGDPFERCFLAHSTADVQGELASELNWDLIALEAAADVTDERAREQQLPGGRRGLLPSLHLNLAYDYAKLGESLPAIHHYREGLRHVDVLDDDDYGRALREAFADFEAEYGAGAASG